MTITYTTSQFRANIYRILDNVLDNGASVEVLHRGKRIKLIPIEVPDKFANLVEHPGFLKCDPEDVVHMDWFDEWDQEPEADLAP